MAFMSSGSKASINIKALDTNAKTISRTFSGVFPFGDLSYGLGAPAGAADPTDAENVRELLNDAARAIISVSRDTYSSSSYTLTESLEE